MYLSEVDEEADGLIPCAGRAYHLKVKLRVLGPFFSVWAPSCCFPLPRPKNSGPHVVGVDPADVQGPEVHLEIFPGDPKDSLGRLHQHTEEKKSTFRKNRGSFEESRSLLT